MSGLRLVSGPKGNIASAPPTLEVVARPIVLRLLPYPLDPPRLQRLKAKFGDEVEVVTCSSFMYGDNPVEQVVSLIDGRNVVAIEVVAPPRVFSELVQSKMKFGEALLIKAIFVEDHGGRPLAVGRSSATGQDTLIFSHYEVLVEFVYVTRPLTAE